MKLEKAKLEQKRKYEKKIDGKKKSKYQRQATKIGYCKVQRHPHRLAAVLRTVYGRNWLSRRSTAYEVLLAQGWSIAYNRRLPTSEKYTKRQVWERKGNCYRLRHQYHVTSDDSWNQPKQNLRLLWKAVFERTIPRNYGKVRRSKWVCLDDSE